MGYLDNDTTKEVAGSQASNNDDHVRQLFAPNFTGNICEIYGAGYLKLTLAISINPAQLIARATQTLTVDLSAIISAYPLTLPFHHNSVNCHMTSAYQIKILTSNFSYFYSVLISIWVLVTSPELAEGV